MYIHLHFLRDITVQEDVTKIEGCEGDNDDNDDNDDEITKRELEKASALQ